MKIRIILLCLVLLATAAWVARASRPEITPIREPLSEMPLRIGNWTAQQSAVIDSKVMDVLGVDDYVSRYYASPDLFYAHLYVGFYQSQREGDTIHSPLNCMPGAGWNPTKRNHITISINDSTSIKVNRIVIVKGLDKQVVLYWYQSHGRIVASEYWGKIYTVIDAMRKNRTDAALVRIICSAESMNAGSEALAEEYAIDFAKALFPLLERFLPS
ncbi:MAG: EpsI family protein [Acidobacteria bacterium]|nr:EpsI family protein [Acidobacteriota bacterium]